MDEGIKAHKGKCSIQDYHSSRCQKPACTPGLLTPSPALPTLDLIEPIVSDRHFPVCLKQHLKIVVVIFDTLFTAI
jgi:hypothetical protein